MNRNYIRSVSFAIVASFALMTIAGNVQGALEPVAPDAVHTLTKEPYEPSDGELDGIVYQPGECTGAVVLGYECAVSNRRWYSPYGSGYGFSDDSAIYLGLGMSFPFAGQDFTAASVCANGYVVLGQFLNGCSYSGLDPDSFPYRYAVVGHGVDLYPSSGGAIYVYRGLINGEAAFMATWLGIYDLFSSQRSSFQIVLFESGKIEINKDSTSYGIREIGIGIVTDIARGLTYQYSSQYSSYRTLTFTPGAGLPDPPIACFSHSATWATYTDELVTFSNCSRPGDAQITSNVWTFGDGSQSSQTNPTKRYADDGAYTVCLAVTDANGLSDTTCRDVRIYNRAPLASFDLESTSVITNVSPITLRDTSTDADGEVVNRRWYVDNRYLSEESVVVELDPLSAGWHYICVVPRDDDGHTRASCRNVFVRAVVMDGHGVAVRNTNGTAQFNVTNTYEQRSTVGFDVTNQSLAYEDANVTIENATATTTATVGQVDTTARLGYLRVLLPNGQTLEAFGVEAKAATNCYEDSGSTSFQALMLDGVPINVNPLDIAPNTRIVLTDDTALVLNKQMPGVVGMTTTAIVVEHPDQTMTGIGYADAGISGCPYEFRA